MPSQTAMIEVKNVNKMYCLRRRTFAALKDVSFTIQHGETLGIVGESGCGKSTLGKAMLMLDPPSSGSVHFMEHDITALTKKQLLPLRRKMQMIFQDPYSSLNPRMTIEEIVGEGLDIHQLYSRSERLDRIACLMDDVGLHRAMLRRYPHEFSGGQRQRIVIARALAVEPDFVVCDEPISALDVCTQARIMDLLKELKEKRQLTYLFVSHDLRAVKAISDNVGVMYGGQIVEYGPVSEIYSRPKHPYTQTLLSHRKRLP